MVENQCINDCLSLEEGFYNFRRIILSNFNIDIKSQFTLPSMAYNIFRSKYYKYNKTPISKNHYDKDKFIRRSYMGGISEVFKPLLRNGYCYDVNSLYPYVMQNRKFPIGDSIFVNCDDIDLNEFIGFIECDVSNDNLELNFLPYRDNLRGFITPIGRWSGVYFSEEIKMAIKLGYKVILKRGLKYKKVIIYLKNM